LALTAQILQRRMRSRVARGARNSLNLERAARGTRPAPTSSSMGAYRRELASPFDEAKIRLVREFLSREFRDCHHRDFFAFDKAAQVFLIETGRGFRHMLVVPKATFEDGDIGRLLNAELAATLKLAREGRVMLTPKGPVVLA
jgi:hypothetical protein